MGDKKVLAFAAVAALIVALALVGCGGSQASSASSASSGASSSASAESSSASAESSQASASSAASLKDSPAEAKLQIEAAMKNQLDEAYGSKIDDSKIEVEKVYTAQEEQSDELLKSYNLGPDEVAFEVKYELHPTEGTDVNELTAATGRYDEKTGWVVDKYNVGILRPNPDGEPAYIITDFGTGF